MSKITAETYINELKEKVAVLNHIEEVVNKCSVSFDEKCNNPFHYDLKPFNVTDDVWYHFDVVVNITINIPRLQRMSEQALKSKKRFTDLYLHNSEIFHKIVAISKNAPGKEIDYLDAMLFKYSDIILELLNDGNMLSGPGDLEHVIRSRVVYEECIMLIKNSDFKIMDNKIIAPGVEFGKMFRHFVFTLQTNSNGGKILDHILKMESGD